MRRPPLTEDEIASLTSVGKPDRLIADGKQSSLYLRVLYTGRKCWVVKTRREGKWRSTVLGVWDREHPRHLTAKQARLKAAATLSMALHPSAVARDRVTVGQAAMQWYRERVQDRYRRPEQTLAYLERDLMPIWGKPLTKLRKADVATIVAAKAPTAGNRLLAIAKQFTRYAATLDWIEADPLAVLSRRNVGTPEQPRERVLSDDEIRAVWAIPAPHGNLYRLLLASGQRLSEGLALAHDGSLVRDGVWHIDENKSGRPHVVPVTPYMQRILADGLPRKQRAAAWSLYKSHVGTDATVHDIRRTCATRMRDLGVPVEVIEALLNHAPPRLIRTYQRPDMLGPMRDALLKWHRELARIVRSSAARPQPVAGRRKVG